VTLTVRAYAIFCSQLKIIGIVFVGTVIKIVIELNFYNLLSRRTAILQYTMSDFMRQVCQNTSQDLVA